MLGLCMGFGSGARRVGLLGFAVVVFLAVASGARAALPSNCSYSGASVVCPFAETGAAQGFTVPAGVQSITVDAFGAQGADANGALGGPGGEATATLAVLPGDPIEVLVGGQGDTFGVPNGGAGGFNAGGAGGPGGIGQFSNGPSGGGGGGASDVRTGVCAGTLSCGLSARVLVAGGGGGAASGGGSCFPSGGGGGNPSGGAGTVACAGGGGGGGGGQTGGGSAGAPDTSCQGAGAGAGAAGGAVSQDAGGAGGSGSSNTSGGNGGGGGGGGYWGGGGGAGSCGIGGGGGGGSSTGPLGASFTNAVRSGDGLVTITYPVNVTTTTVSAPANGTTGTAIAAGSISSTLSGATSGATGTITFTVFGPQASAPSTCSTGGTAVGTATVTGNGSYNPPAGFTPSAAGSYWWYASYSGDSANLPSNSGCGVGMTSTTVTPPPPTCQPVNTTTPAGQAVTVQLNCTDSTGATVNYTIVSGPSNGTLGMINPTTGQVVYTPNSGFSGPDSFTYKASSSNGNATAQTVSIMVTPVSPPGADLAVALSVAPGQVHYLSPVIYTATLTNHGPAAASGVQLKDTLPAGVRSLLILRPAGWSCTTPPVLSSGTITCRTASLASGASATFHFAVVNLEHRGGSLRDTATVSATTTDPNPANNHATITTKVS